MQLMCIILYKIQEYMGFVEEKYELEGILLVYDWD